MQARAAKLLGMCKHRGKRGLNVAYQHFGAQGMWKSVRAATGTCPQIRRCKSRSSTARWATALSCATTTRQQLGCALSVM